MVLVPNEKNLAPEIPFELMFSLDEGEIIAGGNYTAVEADEIAFLWLEERDPFLAASPEGKQAQKQQILKERTT
jgi:hypothetical protein